MKANATTIEELSDYQTVSTLRGDNIEHIRLPAPDVVIIPGVVWGKFDEFFTPAFWISRVWIDGEKSPHSKYSIGESLREEVAACLLGGYGMLAETGLAAFNRLRVMGLLSGDATKTEIEQALKSPFAIEGKEVKYRFPRMKAQFVAAAMKRLNCERPPLGSGRELRDWLLTFGGIGPKTASWIARNCLGADDVAILDVHIIRAGILMGLFPSNVKVDRDYFKMEAKLIRFAQCVGLQLSILDSILWCYMRSMSKHAIRSVMNISAERKEFAEI